MFLVVLVFLSLRRQINKERIMPSRRYRTKVPIVSRILRAIVHFEMSGREIRYSLTSLCNKRMRLSRVGRVDGPLASAGASLV